ADLAKAVTPGAVVEFEVPPNLIPAGCKSISPQMLPLVVLEQDQIDSVARSVPGGASNVQDIYPLAPLQEGILFHHLLDLQGSDTYVVSTLLSVSSRERVDGLITALQQVIDRHDILRTAVQWDDLASPVQVVYRRATLPVEALRLDPTLDPVMQLRESLKLHHQRMDLRKAPLVRLKVAADP